MKTLLSASYFKWLNDFKIWKHISLKTKFKQKLFKSVELFKRNIGIIIFFFKDCVAFYRYDQVDIH